MPEYLLTNLNFTNNVCPLCLGTSSDVIEKQFLC